MNCSILDKVFGIMANTYVWGYLRFNESAGFYNYSDKSIKLWSDKDVSIGSSSSTCCTFTGNARRNLNYG